MTSAAREVERDGRVAAEQRHGQIPEHRDRERLRVREATGEGDEVSTTGELDLTDQQKKDILAFVHDDGKGFVGIHAALDTNYKWPEYGEMIGAWFDQETDPNRLKLEMDKFLASVRAA